MILSQQISLNMIIHHLVPVTVWNFPAVSTAIVTQGAEWTYTIPGASSRCCAVGAALSRWCFPVARWRGKVEREGGGSRRPLAALAVGSEKRRNVGQLCHSFEVETAYLWSWGSAISFHVLLSCDLGRPRLQKPYWLYPPKKKKKEKRGTILF